MTTGKFIIDLVAKKARGDQDQVKLAHGQLPDIAHLCPANYRLRVNLADFLEATPEDGRFTALLRILT